MASVPTRRCIGCGNGDVTTNLVRITAGPDAALQVDAERRLGGRGAWVHPQERCFETALKPGRLERALRMKVRDRSGVEAFAGSLS